MSPRLDELVRTLDAAIPEAMRDRDVPGLAIGLCDVAGTRWSAGYGTTAKGGGEAITSATRFSVQSTSKLVTATAVMLAVQDGLVDLDAPIATYLPDFTVNSVFEDDAAARITLRHLLSHTAGFTHEAPLGSNHDPGDGDFDAHCRSAFDTWLRFPVGHHHEYSNIGIDLAGYVLQRVTGVPFAEQARRALLAPLGMARSTFDPAVVEADPERAVGHTRALAAAGPLPVAVPMIAAGGLYTTVDDALRFVGLHLGGGAPLLAPALAAEQLQVPFAEPEQELGYGLGVYVDEWAPGVRVHHHGGSGFGFQAQLLWVPEVQVGAVVLTNSFDHDVQNELARTIVAHLAAASPRAAPPAPAAAALAAPDAGRDHDLGELVGEYVGRNDDRLTVTLEGGRLLVHGDATRAARLVGPCTIELDGPGRERYRFRPGRGGAAGYLVALRDGQTRYRNDAAQTPPSTLPLSHAGDYATPSWGAGGSRYRLAQDGDSPVLRRLADDGGPAEPDIALRLTPIAADLYLSSTGEALDLRSTPPTYANVALSPPST